MAAMATALFKGGRRRRRGLMTTTPALPKRCPLPNPSPCSSIPQTRKKCRSTRTLPFHGPRPVQKLLIFLQSEIFLFVAIYEIKNAQSSQYPLVGRTDKPLTSRVSFPRSFRWTRETQSSCGREGDDTSSLLRGEGGGSRVVHTLTHLQCTVPYIRILPSQWWWWWWWYATCPHQLGLTALATERRGGAQKGLFSTFSSLSLGALPFPHVGHMCCPLCYSTRTLEKIHNSCKCDEVAETTGAFFSFKPAMAL